MFPRRPSQWPVHLLLLFTFALVVTHDGLIAAAEDYTLMWWADGFQGRSPDGQWCRVVQTNRYAVVLDVERMTIPHLGLVANPLPYSAAVRQDNSVWSSLPAAELGLEIAVDGVTYRCTHGGQATDHDGPRIIESGRFVQRADVTNLVFASRDGRELPVQARFETLAWPDRLTLLLEASPRLLPNRETAAWQDAALTLRLTTGGQTLEKRVQSPPDAPWTLDKPGQVALAIEFSAATPGLPAAPTGDLSPDVQVVASDVQTGAQVPAAYDPDRGWMRIDLDGITKQGDENNRLERVRLQIHNLSDQEQPVRLLFNKTQDLPITGMSAVLRDQDGFPTGMPVQLSKNWHRRENHRLTYEGPWFRGFTYLRLPARAERQLELVLSGAHWGGVAAASHAQLCLVGWGSNQLWDQTAIGSWGESFCFEPDRAQASALVCDVRPLMVHAMNQDVPTKWSWTNNVGGGDAFRLFAPDGTYMRPTRMKTAYLRHGPCLTEVIYAGTLSDGAAEHSVTTSLYRTDDLARCIYRLRLDVSRQLDYSRFVIFQIGADTYSYTRDRKMAVGNETGLIREWNTQWGGDCYRTSPVLLDGRIPWVSLHDAESRDPSQAGAWANRGLVIRSWRARLGGKECGPWLAEHGVRAGDAATSTADILPPPDVQRFEPGDFVEATMEHIVVPQFARDYYGPNESLRTALSHDENTWQMIHRETTGNDLLIEATVGEVEQTRPVVLRAADNRAEFTITGGNGYVPIAIHGLSAFRTPRLEWKTRATNGNWQAIDQATIGNDFWQTDFDPSSETWELTFTIPADTPDDHRQRREFRFTLLAH